MDEKRTGGYWDSIENMMKEYDYFEWRKVIYYLPEYAPSGRGLRIAPAWVYNETEHAIQGWYTGYEGGGCHGEYAFLAIFNKKNEIIHHYVTISLDDDWDEDLVTKEDWKGEIAGYVGENAPISFLAMNILRKEYLSLNEEETGPFFVPEHKLSPEEWDGYLNITEDGREYILFEGICPMEVDMYRQVQRNWRLSARLTDEFLDEEKI